MLRKTAFRLANKIHLECRNEADCTNKYLVGFILLHTLCSLPHYTILDVTLTCKLQIYICNTCGNLHLQ